ncbi:uncharacterized protein DUF4342 [Saccharothrix carnea]|uniref:Uncharacterized protein DUF4342 n=1 Tax=Saccharothrix carnea TaxID=1280637 RepID=A0A2P8I038_SACCR|nr:DUF4342 domain-containing protein [Saccharothrix carnea]PSL51829.1 uncharacterized protein DUF4342 [Saccharothrix carnea]
MTEQGDRQAPGIEALTEKIRQLVHEGNTRRVVVRNGEGEPVLDIPVTAGVVAAVAAPVVTAVAALAALAGPWSLGVERQEETPPAETTADTAPADADVDATAADAPPADTAQPEDPSTDADTVHGKGS